MLHLRHGPFELDLAPEVGGSVAAFRAHGVDLLFNDERARRGVDDVLGMSAFPLLPFCGRIAGSRFEFAGRRVELPGNLPPEPHAIHGHGWRDAWTTEWSTHSSAALRFEHPADAWPWRYEARQTLTLDRHGLSVELELTNLDAAEMPAGLGWHPYFPRRDAALAADVRNIWPSGADMIPAGAAALDDACDLRRPRAVAGLALDDAFGAGPGGATLIWPDRTLALSAEPPLGFLVVYTPAGRDTFCVEPISHVPDAVNSALAPALTGLRVLGSGRSLATRITLSVELSGGGP
ncbi:MAG: aldose 1-epimerase [Pseudomonadales bacterium]